MFQEWESLRSNSLYSQCELFQMTIALHSINLLDGRATTTTWSSTTEVSTRHASLWHTTTTSSLVDFHHDGVDNAFKLLLFGFELVLLSQLVLVQPVESFSHSRFNLFLVTTLKFVFEFLFLQSIPHGEAIVLETILGFNLALVGLILST